MKKLENNEALKNYLNVGNSINESESKSLKNTIKNNNQIKQGKTDLWRNVSSKEFGFKTEGELRKAIVKNPKILNGKTIIPGGFVSTAKTQEGTLGFSGVQIHITNIDKNVEGTDVSKYASHKSENEILFQKGTGYRIDNVELDIDEDDGFINYMGITATLVEGNSHSRGIGNTSDKSS